MSYEIEKFRNDPLRPGESQARIVIDTDLIEGTITREQVTIHPWVRGKDRSVYIQVGYEELDLETGQWNPSESDEGAAYSWNAIVDRDDFLDALLAVFPDEILDLRE